MKLNTRLYAAYGSNMNTDQMAVRCTNAEELGVGVVMDYELCFAHGGVANIKPCAESKVPVVIWQVNRADEIALDYYEGYPKLYIKRIVTAVFGGMTSEIMVYVLKEPFDREKGTPTMKYYNAIQEGYISHGIDLKTLESAYNNIKGGGKYE